MLRRCSDPRAKQYCDYGGRGIRVCDAWQEFANFYADMGDRPRGMTIDRYPDNDGNYEPGNCRWATASQQRRNSRSWERTDRARAIGIAAPAVADSGSANPSAKLTEERVAEMRRRYLAGAAISDLVPEFGVSWVVAARAIYRETWKHVA